MSRASRAARTISNELRSSWFEPSLHSAYFRISSKLIASHPAVITGPPRLLPLIDFLPLLEAFRAIERPEGGIELGLAIPFFAHGPAGLSALCSDTLWDAMVTIVRYTPVRNAMFDRRCFQQGDAAILEFWPRLHLGGFEKFFGYTTVLALYNILRAISEDVASDSTRLTFPWEMPSNLRISDKVPTTFGFDEQFLSIRVPLEMAMEPSASADPDLCERLKMAGEDELTRLIGGTAAKVRELLRQKAPAWPSLQEVADELATSKRTLIRKLESEKLSYNVLLDDARKELACRLLRSSDMQLSKIAEQVGFSDQAGFARSFRRVQGCSPSQYRASFRRAADLA
ncbi:AraC family transcriptional regulator [Bradyrhizobium sp. CCBAU 53338]|uniref:AraC family transcriptional regulator n=1 Tax=Bradyrhizobium sp. CCBAU 53338 TaxID=1325111 RepID=UPI00188D08AB|nr:AraC family transcriptional regulator [Bradyrhizobium sp. CCBAU 53338]QOZ51478.1 hypothetical protein XH90_08870 [Bradyrhizobium sp. CCBAU 53338]